MKKIIIAGAFMVAVGFSANAGNPKTEAKADAKSTEAIATPSETVSTTSTTTYYVIDEVDADHWAISQDPSNDGNCDGGSIPCQFTSSNSNLGSSVSKSDVSSGAQGINVTETRSSL